jgi:hypothetical protein
MSRLLDFIVITLAFALALVIETGVQVLVSLRWLSNRLMSLTE